MSTDGVGMSSGTRTGSEDTPSASDVRRSTQAWESLFRAQVAVMRRLQHDDIWDELSLREYDLLFTLSRAEGGCARLRELGETSLLSQPSLSRMVERLEAGGSVRRSPAPDDGRGVVVSLTDQGARLQRAVGRRHAQAIHHYVGSVLDAQELTVLQALTDKLRAGQTQVAPATLGPVPR